MLVQIHETTSELREAVSTGGLWFGTLTPSIILWLVFKNRLTTGDRMLAWGYKGDTTCVFCRNGIESRNHLFFGCGFCSCLWRTCMERCNIPNPPNDWEDILEEGCRSWKTKAMRGVLCRLVLSACHRL